MEILGYMASLLIGVSLGMIGGGGSILAVPVLVYLFGLDIVVASAYSLVIVGITSLIGAGRYYFKNLVNLKTAIIFGIPSIISVYLTRAIIIPAIPIHVFTLGDFIFTKNLFLMMLFTFTMIISSLSMIKKRDTNSCAESNVQKFNYPLIFIEGILVGILTGLIGAGGGFLIIPALVLLSKLPMKEAIGTSLLIISAKSIIGFMGDKSITVIDYHLLILVSLFSVAGLFIGLTLSNKFDGIKLKSAFGWFVLIIGISILFKEIFLV